MDDGRCRFKTQALERRPVAQILWFQVVSLFVEIVSGLEILASLGVLALFVDSLGLIGRDSRQYGNHDQQHYCRRHQTSHSSVLVYKVFAGQTILNPGPANRESPRSI